MKSLAISVKERENVGKSSSKALRNQGKVPCVLYGGEKQVCFFAHENDLRKLVYTSDVFLVDLDIEGKKTRCVMQDIQFHPVTDKILHIDFLEVFDDKEVTVEIPVILQGMSPGVRNGGNLLFRRKKIITRAIPGNLPDAIEVDISELKIGDFIFSPVNPLYMVSQPYLLYLNFSSFSAIVSIFNLQKGVPSPIRPSRAETLERRHSSKCPIVILEGIA